MDIDRQKLEISGFQGLWRGGYYEGDPLDPMSRSVYGVFGYCSILYLTYMACIKPYVTSDTTVLEIGPGRGAWTRCFRDAKHIWALDALSSEHNHFWEYVGRADNIEYHKVQDNTCAQVPDDAVDFFFSFGTFCHMSPPNIRDYMEHVYRKMRRGARGFFMFADYDKYNAMLAAEDRRSVYHFLSGKRFTLMRWIYKAIPKLGVSHHRFSTQNAREGDAYSPGRWYHLGTTNAARMMEAIGFEVIDADIGVNHRDPMIHFRKM